jgi:hypothetical protein
VSGHDFLETGRGPLARQERALQKLADAVRAVERAVADLDDTDSDRAAEQLKAPTRVLVRRWHALRDERAARGLGDPAVTGSAPGGPTEPSAGEPVGRGRVKTRLRT